MPFFGAGFGDFVTAIDLVKTTLQNIKSAPQDFKDAERTLQSLDRLLVGLQSEVESPTSVFRRDDSKAEQLNYLIQSCHGPLVKLNDVLSKVDSLGTSSVKPFHRIRYSKKTVLEIRGEIAFRYAELSSFLKTVELGGIGRLENQVEDMQGTILEAIDRVVAQARLDRRNSSYMSDHSNDDKAVWKQFRHDLVKAGFKSADLERYKTAIFDKFTELKEHGLLDWDASEFADSSSEQSTPTFIAHERANYRPATISTVYDGSVDADSGAVDSPIDSDASSSDSTVTPVHPLPPLRVWKGKYGNINIKARLVRVDAEYAFVQTASNEDIILPLTNLDEEELGVARAYQTTNTTPTASETRIFADATEFETAEAVGVGEHEADADQEEPRCATSSTTQRSDYDTEVRVGQRSISNPSWRFRRPGDIHVQHRQSSDMRKDALPKAASQGNITKVRKLLGKGHNIEASGPLSYSYERSDGEGGTVTKWVHFPETTALYRAAEQGQFETAHLLLRRGANPNTTSRSGSSLLRGLVNCGGVGMARLLLEYGANVNMSGPLRGAAFHNRVSFAKLLLEYGAAIDGKDFTGETALYKAALNGHTRMAEVLLDQGANTRVLTKDGQSALYKAAGQDYVNFLRTLLLYGADPAIGTGKSGETALYKACRLGHERTVECLLRRHADPDAENVFKQTDYGTKKGLLMQVLRPTESNGPEIGLRPLHAAARLGHLAIAQLLLDYGSDVNARPKNGKPAVYMAAEVGHKDMVKLLLAAGAQLLDVRYIDPVARFLGNDNNENIEALDEDNEAVSKHEAPWLARLRQESLPEGGDGLKTLAKLWDRAKRDGTAQRVMVQAVLGTFNVPRR